MTDQESKTTMKDVIVLLHGIPGVGKDTVADRLVSHHGFKKVAYAKLLKDYVSEAYGIQREWLDDTVKKEQPLQQYPAIVMDKFSGIVFEHCCKHFKTMDGQRPSGLEYTMIHEDWQAYLHVKEQHIHEMLFHTPRTMMIYEGCIKRAVDQNFWVKRAYEGISDRDHKVVVSDFRFPGEYRHTVQRFGGYKGNRRVITVKIVNGEDTEYSDSSETSLRDFSFDYILNNRERGLVKLWGSVELLLKLFSL